MFFFCVPGPAGIINVIVKVHQLFFFCLVLFQSFFYKYHCRWDNSICIFCICAIWTRCCAWIYCHCLLNLVATNLRIVVFPFCVAESELRRHLPHYVHHRYNDLLSPFSFSGLLKDSKDEMFRKSVMPLSTLQFQPSLIQTTTFSIFLSVPTCYVLELHSMYFYVRIST